MKYKLEQKFTKKRQVSFWWNIQIKQMFALQTLWRLEFIQPLTVVIFNFIKLKQLFVLLKLNSIKFLKLFNKNLIFIRVLKL